MSLQKQITEEMAKIAYQVLDKSGKLTPESDIKDFKRVAKLVAAYKDLQRLLVKASEIEGEGVER